MTDEKIVEVEEYLKGIKHFGEYTLKESLLRALLARLREAEERERILQQQNDAYDTMGADLSARIQALEEAAREVIEAGRSDREAAIDRLSEVLERK